MERSLDEHPFGQLLDIRPGDSEAVQEIAYAPVPAGYRNPLQDEPNPLLIAAVRRFGFAGLIACALGSAVARLLHSR